MTIHVRRMTTRLGTAGMLVALLCGLAGCGGSGSSGFDAVASEALTIQHVIDAGDCRAFESQTFCASGVEAPGPFEGALVSIAPQVEPLVCEGSLIAEKCTVPLEFTTEGFTEPTSLLAAVAQNENGPWQLAPLTVIEHIGGPRSVAISVPGRTDETEPTPVIAAVLVYRGEAPADLPASSARLADFDVDLIYLSQRLEVVVPR